MPVEAGSDELVSVLDKSLLPTRKVIAIAVCSPRGIMICLEIFVSGPGWITIAPDYPATRSRCNRFEARNIKKLRGRSQRWAWWDRCSAKRC